MTLTYQQAKDEMFAIFKTAWDTTGYPVHYQDVKTERADTEEPWSAIFIQHTAGAQTTLSGAVGTRTFSRVGILTVQIFTPVGNGLQDSYDLAKVVSDAFEGTSSPGGVWFRNVRLNEVGRDGEFFQLNVIVEFNYDEIK